MELTFAIVQFAGCSIAVVVSAVFLTVFSDRIARLTRIGHLIAGSLLLAIATSLPELSMNLAILRIDLPDMAIGGIIGSCLFNLGILAAADIAHRSSSGVFSNKTVESALPGVVSIGLASVFGIGILLNDRIGTVEWIGLGPCTIAILVAYFLGSRLIWRNQRAEKITKETPADTAAPQSNLRSQTRTAILGYLLCAALVFVIAPWSASAALVIANKSGWGETFVGTTIVALTTSLPEMVTCMAAIRIGAMNLAVGSIFGSNMFNLLLLIPLDLAFPGSLIGAASSTHILTCLFVIAITAAIVIGQVYRAESRILLVEPDAFLVLVLVTIAVYLVFISG